MRAMWFMVPGAVVAAGCGADSVVTSEVVSAVECDVTRCGTNSPVIDSLRFHDLSLVGVPNAQGLWIEQFVDAGGTGYTLAVRDGQIFGTRGGATLAHAALRGARIILRDRSGRIPGEISVTIADVLPLHYWAKSPKDGQHPDLEAYNLQYSAAGAQGSLCGNPVDGEGRDQIGDPLGMVVNTAVVFEGDRIDADSITVSPTIDRSWFNIGCAGHAIAKLALTGHTEAARAKGFVSTPAERQAMLKMLVGDYCGVGAPFTIPGEPLFWRDDHGWMDFKAAVQPVVEARWTSAGAACLGDARLDIHPPTGTWPSGLMPRPGGTVAELIATKCPSLPRCADPDVFDQDGVHLVSANPQP